MSMRLLLADDHPIVLKGLQELLASAGFDVVAACRDGGDALAALRQHRPALAVVDLMLPGLSGLDLARTVRTESLPTRLVLLTAAASRPALLQAVRLGVCAIVTKDQPNEVLLDALRCVRDGGTWILDELLRSDGKAVLAAALADLSAREREVVLLAVRGQRNKQIAHQLGLTEGTVKIHLHRIYAKLNVTSRMELAEVARREGLV